MLERESLTGGDHRERLDELAQEKRLLRRGWPNSRRWEEESRLIGELRAIRDQLEAHAAATQGRARSRTDEPAVPC